MQRKPSDQWVVLVQITGMLIPVLVKLSLLVSHWNIFFGCYFNIFVINPPG